MLYIYIYALVDVSSLFKAAVTPNFFAKYSTITASIHLRKWRQRFFITFCKDLTTSDVADLIRRSLSKVSI